MYVSNQEILDLFHKLGKDREIEVTRRLDELLAANNRYLQEARDARAYARTLEIRIEWLTALKDSR